MSCGRCAVRRPCLLVIASLYQVKRLTKLFEFLKIISNPYHCNVPELSPSCFIALARPPFREACSHTKAS